MPQIFNPLNGKAGGGGAEYRGEWTDEALRAFIELEREPLLQEYSYDLRSKAEKQARAVRAAALGRPFRRAGTECRKRD